MAAHSMFIPFTYVGLVQRRSVERMLPVNAVSKPHRRRFYSRKLVSWVTLGTAGCVSVAALVNHFFFRAYGDEVLATAYLVSALIPALLAVPLFGYLSLKMKQLHRLNQELSRLASTDAMTGLHNRSAFSGLVARLLGEMDLRSDCQAIALLVVDADFFKRINDIHGHQAGDQALIAIAGALRRTVGEDGLVGRLGGEEFGVVLPCVPIEEAYRIAEAMRGAVADIVFRPGGVSHSLSVSVGVTVTSGPAGFDDMFRDADQRLYEAKSGGRNQVRIGAYRAPSIAAPDDLRQLLNRLDPHRGTGAPDRADVG